MKKALILISALALILSACAIQETTGSIKMQLPHTAARDLASSSTVRVSLYRYGVSQPIDGSKTVIEQVLATGDSIEISGLQAGPGYRLAMALGNYEGQAFHPAQYGTSDEFTVSSDLAVAVQLALTKTPFTWLSDAAKPSVAVLGSGAGAQVWLYAANQLQRLDTNPVSVAVADVASSLPGRSVNSITSGLRFATVEGAADNSFANQLWLNTTKGIVPYESGFKLDYMKAGMSPDVLFSTALTIKADPNKGKKLVVFYSGAGMVLGGAGVDNPALAPADWEWADLESKINDMGEFKDMLSGGADVLKSIAVGNGFYYIATSINTFRIDGALTASFPVDSSAADTGSWITNNILNGTDTIVSIPGETISQVATAGSYFYAGTNHGLFVSAIDGSGKLSAGSTRLGSASDRIASLAAVAYADSVYAAAITASGKLILVINNAIIGQYDSMAGVPDGKVTPSWWIQADGLVLLLAGDNSAVRMTVR